MDQQIWQWTLTKEAIAPCFVRDVLAMRQPTDKGADYFWLGHTPCRTVVLVGMVVGIQSYEHRTLYTIDDGTAVIDCVLRHPHPTLPAPAPRVPPRSTGGLSAKSKPISSPKKPRLDKVKLESTEPPPPITEPGYPVRVVGRVVRHYESKQIHADTIDLCPSSLDEIAHLENVIMLHKTKYSLAVTFVPPPKLTSRSLPLDTLTDADGSVFSNKLLPSRPIPSTASYSLPPPLPMPLQSRNQSSVPAYLHSTYHDHTHVPSSPAASSIASSTPSSPCKQTSPIKGREAPHKPKLRHPSRLHTRDLTGNTFRIYVKHYMDNAPPPFSISLSSPSRSTCGGATTPKKHARGEDEFDEPTPRPRPVVRHESWDGRKDEDEQGPLLGFTLSHLRRIPELALLAARVIRAEARKRDKADREKDRGSSRIPSSSSTSARQNVSKNGNGSIRMPQTGTGLAADPSHAKMKRLFSWAVVKLYEEGSIVLWDGDVRPLPVPPPPVPEGERERSGLWKREDETQSTFGDPSVLYSSSASASLYSHYHSPRRPRRRGDARDVLDVGADADTGYVSDPGMDEEAYVPLTPWLLAEYVREAVSALRRRHQGDRRGGAGGGANGRGREPTPEDILTYLQRADGRWARVGVWAVEEALGVLKTG